MRIAAYARVSTKAQAEYDLSIPDQVRQIREWAIREGHDIVTEYIEPGASATDDKRPVFQKMIADAFCSPHPFQAIAVHSFSRFFRDHVSKAIYERKLGKIDVRVISITQHTTDDPAGNLARHMMSLIDEYSSEENAKHVKRGMCENARQGNFNGSKPPFGYKTVGEGKITSRGRQKKVLQVEPAEAEIVLEIFERYVHGREGPRLGMKAIAMNLESRGIRMRGAPWRIQTIHTVLSNRAYIGEHVFNRTDSKTRRIKDRAEWITISVPPIVETDLFDKASKLREAYAPAKSVPRRLHTPTLLTGLLKCECGAGMTLATGKSGQYRYYKCTKRMDRGNAACSSRNIPVDMLDNLVLDAFRREVCSPDRVRAILDELRKHLAESSSDEQIREKKLKAELRETQGKYDKLLEAVENGLPMSDRITERAHQLTAKQQDIQLQIAGLNRKRQLPMNLLTPKKVEAFSHVLNARLGESSKFAQGYLRELVSEIRVTGNRMQLSGPKVALANLVAANAVINRDAVPSSVSDWRTRQDSNL